MATTRIGIMHSGTPPRHDSHINAITDGIMSLGLSNTGGTPDFEVARIEHAKDQPLDSIARNLNSDTTIGLIVAAGGTASALAAKTATSGSGKWVVFTSVAEWTTAVANMTGIIAGTTKSDRDRLKTLAKLVPTNATVGVLLRKGRPDYASQKAMLTTEAGTQHLTPNFQDIDPTAATAVETQSVGYSRIGEAKSAVCL
jgi:ABC-type uncharacterized transport system substrate-binding protein